MPAPLTAPRVPSGFLPLATTSGLTALPGSPTVLRIEASGQTATPSSQAAHGTEARSPTATPGG
jgi:hypothetical protein